MSDDAMMRLIGVSIRRRANVLPKGTAGTDFYDEEAESADDCIVKYAPTSGTSAFFFNATIPVSQRNAGLLKAILVENYEVESVDIASARNDATRLPVREFWANAPIRKIQWGSAKVGSGFLTTNCDVPLDNVASSALTKHGDTAIVEGQRSIEDHVQFLLTTSKLPYATALAQRLVEMAIDLEQDEEEAIKLSESSVGSLISFLEANPTISRPMLAPTVSGEIVARWMHERFGTLDVYFLPSGRVQYYLANTIEGELDIDSGSTSIGNLRKKLERHEVIDSIVK